MQRIARSRSVSNRSDGPTLCKRQSSGPCSDRTPAPVGIATLAPAFSQGMPTLGTVPTAFSHEFRAELLYELCSALVREGLGGPETWRKCDQSAQVFAQRAIMESIGEERWNPRATTEDMLRAIKAVQLASVLSQFPQGLDTTLGPGAVGLSGGERQRLAIARALLRESAVLILDEATSALDIPTERAVLASLAEFRAHQTLIVISHRISALTWMDRFALLDQGQLAAVGAHSVLYAQSADYRSLYHSSAQGPSLL